MEKRRWGPDLKGLGSQTEEIGVWPGKEGKLGRSDRVSSAFSETPAAAEQKMDWKGARQGRERSSGSQGPARPMRTNTLGCTRSWGCKARGV